MKVCLDTNVVVSAVATRGICADLFHVILAEHELVLGETVLAELRRLRRKMGLPAATIDDLEQFLRRQATVVAGRVEGLKTTLDAGDAAVLEEAAAAAVDVLVTGDRELLEVRGSGIRIVSPRGLWELLRAI